MRILKIKTFSTAILALCALVASQAPVFGQASYTAQIRGVVTDQTRAVVSNATVTITNDATNISVTAHSNDNGLYLLTVFLSVKAYSLESAIGDFAPAVSDQTMILPILNGMKHMDTLAAHFGARAVLGGACKAATMLDKQGRIVQLTKLQDLAYGEMDGSRSERVTRLHEFMQGAGFEARISQSIVLEMWQKWTLLATLGGVTCLMRGNTGEIEGAYGGREFLTKFLNEVVSIVEAVGTALGEAFIAATAETAAQTRCANNLVALPGSARRQSGRGGPDSRRSPAARSKGGAECAVNICCLYPSLRISESSCSDALSRRA